MIDIKENIALAPFTTFKIGGPAKYFVDVSSVDNLQEALNWAKENDEKIFILAGGSNILFADEGFYGIVIKLNLTNLAVNRHATEVEAGASVSLFSLIMNVCEAGLSGMEKMYGIPGTVGGAVRGNAGAFGTEVCNVLKSVTALDTNTNEIRKFSNKECEFGYRSSFFKKNNEWIVLSAVLSLTEGDEEKCVKDAEDTLAARNDNQLQNVQAAGSFFINPLASKDVQEMFMQDKDQEARNGKVPAGWLIEKTGLKNARVGGAQVSEQRANYIINTGDATAKDVLALAEMIKKEVKEKFNVELEEEVKIVV